MSIRFSCPKCAKLYEVPVTNAGGGIRCPCGQSVRIPSAPTELWVPEDAVPVPPPRRSTGRRTVLVLFALAVCIGLVWAFWGFFVGGGPDRDESAKLDATAMEKVVLAHIAELNRPLKVEVMKIGPHYLDGPAFAELRFVYKTSWRDGAKDWDRIFWVSPQGKLITVVGVSNWYGDRWIEMHGKEVPDKKFRD